MSRLQFRMQNRRRGATLVIIVAFLALGLSLGIAFLFKANSQAEFMRKFRESGQGGRSAGVNTGSLGNNDEAPPQPSDLFNTALGQVIYDVPDDETGWFNALRGHGLARAMYGWNRQQALSNTQPYNGFGRTHAASGADWYSFINYQRLPGSPNLDPEWESGSFIAKSAPYTAPDENNVAIAAVKSDGYVLVPSFHRPWLLTNPGAHGGTGAGDQFRQLRPRAIEHPNFAGMTANNDFNAGTGARSGSWGDVENLEGKNIIFPGTQARLRQHDSVWIDLDMPVRKWKGRNYKPLFAFLIVDLDSRINANVAGNRKSATLTSTSNQGWGPWEINMDQVLGGAPGSSAPFFGGAAGNPPFRRYLASTTPTKSFSLVTPDTIVVPFGAGAPFLANDAAAPFYSRIDFDGSAATGGAAPATVQAPLAQYRTSPLFAGRNNNGTTLERTTHPLFYNPYFLPQKRQAGNTTDRAFGPEDLYILNQKLNGETQAYYRTSDMGALVPQLTTPTLPLGNNPRWFVTPISNDIQVPGMRPWRLPPPPTSVGATYQKAGAYPPVLANGAAIPSPTPGNQAPSIESDFNTTPVSDWRSVVAMLGVVDLNRKLTDYRQTVTDSFENNATAGTLNFARAQADRQALARDIFDRLAAATGARTVGTAPLPAAGSAEYNALRQLAQMAVNIVDYIDNDDYMTPFDWLANGTEILWGTELPRLVINEAYAQTWNRGMIPNGQANGWTNNGNNHFEIYAELHNPLTPPATPAVDVNLSHGGGAPLTFGGNPVYRMKILRDNTYDPQLRQETNLTGDLNPPNTVIVPALSNNPNQVVLPSDATAAGTTAGGTNPSFYVIGPNAQVPGSDNVQVSYLTNALDIQTVPDGAGNAQPLDRPPTLLLQRLACPHLPAQPDPSLPNYNVYITVDYMIMPNGSVYDFREANGNAGNPPPVANRNTAFSYGRSQPYAAYAGALGSRLAQQTKVMPPATEINHSFHRHNTNADSPFEWLVHMDRPLISPVELLCVSAWKPHELTQQFVIGNNPLSSANKQLHLADWGQSGNIPQASASRLYRAFSLLEIRNRTHGMPLAGRIPGKININTIYELPVFRAMADAGTGNLFTAASVSAAWNRVQVSRSRLITGGSAVWAPPAPLLNGLGDRYLLPAPSFVNTADVQFPNGEDASRSPLGSGFFSNTNSPAADHPYLRNELLNKIFNNITTRSNTFGVWCTIGYFEVTNVGPFSATRRPQLGAEIDLDTGANVRHKFFAIVDRTNLTIDPTSTPARVLQGQRPVFLSYEPIPANPADLRSPDPDTTATRTVQVRVPATSPISNGVMGTYDGAAWRIVAGDAIMIWDTTGAPVTATVAGGPNAPTFTAGIGGTITLSLPPALPPAQNSRHIRGALMQLPSRNPNNLNAPVQTFARLGNPGPQPGFDYRDQRYSGVVRFVTEVKR